MGRAGWDFCVGELGVGGRDETPVRVRELSGVGLDGLCRVRTVLRCGPRLCS